ncbi:hypothetical protein Y032_0019g3762 [Ancylostoma ceylanicum]|uniref:Uncharacterized protein n=1 Tax=Ancylostoma ceylanicum TaxID=53326 RepID=A0A016V2T4_9BILA|nr:hypothetical protein Y032_0019g3762 [Ancylostoma ceylanicum]
MSILSILYHIQCRIHFVPAAANATTIFLISLRRLAFCSTLLHYSHCNLTKTKVLYKTSAIFVIRASNNPLDGSVGKNLYRTRIR